MAPRKQPIRQYKSITLSVLLIVIAGGWTLNRMIEGQAYQSDSVSTHQRLFERRFNRAIDLMLETKYALAATEWERLILVDPSIPEIHVNRGFSLFELGKYEAAKKAFLTALDLNSYQTNAYYGLGIAFEKLADIEGATGSMRSYIHLAKDDDNFVRKARSALSKWESLQQNTTGENAVDSTPVQ